MWIWWPSSLRNTASGARPRGESGSRAKPTKGPGLPIHSLYGETRKPTPEMLEGLDVLLFDIQDVGARYYTYVSTMAMAMEAAGEAGIPFVVLDRPNPIGGVAVQGTVLDPDFSTFVGLYPVPMRHGMTPGELARLYVGEFGIQVELKVIPVEGWTREHDLRRNESPLDRPLSEHALGGERPPLPGHLPVRGNQHLRGPGNRHRVSGRGSSLAGPETLWRRPWPPTRSPGVRIRPVSFTPENPGDGKFGGQESSGVRLAATGPRLRPDPGRSGSPHGDPADVRGPLGVAGSPFRRLAGTDRLREGLEAGRPLEELREGWDEDLELSCS